MASSSQRSAFTAVYLKVPVQSLTITGNGPNKELWFTSFIHSFIHSCTELLNHFQLIKWLQSRSWCLEPIPGHKAGTSHGQGLTHRRVHTLTETHFHTLWGQYKLANQPIVCPFGLWKPKHLEETQVYMGRAHKRHTERASNQKSGIEPGTFSL